MKCGGCQRPELHKMCPAYGTPFYMSGIPFTELIEDLIKEIPEEMDAIFQLELNQYVDVVFFKSYDWYEFTDFICVFREFNEEKFKAMSLYNEKYPIVYLHEWDMDTYCDTYPYNEREHYLVMREKII